MIAKPLLAALLTCAVSTFSLHAQQAAPKPLQAMPYSPSLDVTSLDRSVDPCTDFYKFSCGGWEKNNPIPADQASWSVYAKLANDNQQFLWGILEDDAKELIDVADGRHRAGDVNELAELVAIPPQPPPAGLGAPLVFE